MLREFIAGIRPVNAQYKAKTDMKTGQAVVKDRATMEAKFPTAATATDLYFVNKERIPTGVNTARKDMSDYDANFVKVVAGEMVKLKNFVAGEEFGVDCIDKKPTVNKAVMADTNGNLVDATVPSKYLYVGDVDDNGRTLLKIVVLDEAKTN